MYMSMLRIVCNGKDDIRSCLAVIYRNIHSLFAKNDVKLCIQYLNRLSRMRIFPSNK